MSQFTRVLKAKLGIRYVGSGLCLFVSPKQTPLVIWGQGWVACMLSHSGEVGVRSVQNVVRRWGRGRKKERREVRLKQLNAEHSAINYRS